ncbi:helix-turn-helix domain-containing protein [Streptomyces sp. bgisy022]|uniref:helix-turn-helix domain-containing protein n=1 Tax=Streptomyces sp. bgisy022 TaxID=3413769 RepID=UPI003D70F225
MGAGAKQRLGFVDRLLATFVHLRYATAHDVLSCWFGVDRSTVTRAAGKVWAGCRVLAGGGLRVTRTGVVTSCGMSCAGCGGCGDRTVPLAGRAGERITIRGFER